ncbi:NAD(P)-binding protein [Earliella scabrosa]|nr:NAD(P)-binding protein [Earliella scabrosa]
MDFGLENVHVLVTGASGGIGLATTRQFLKLGALVTAHYHTKSAPLDPLLQEYGPDRIRALPADLTQESAVVVVNHGIFGERYVPVAEMGLDQWESTIKTNLTSSFLVVREYMRGLERASDSVRDKAAIVLIGSVGGKWGVHGFMDYAVTKSAMMYGMCLSLKNEIVKIAPKGRVNAVAPGWVRTPMIEELINNPDAAYPWLATTALRKVATPEDVANQIVVLSSSTVSGHVTGHVLMVEGGSEGRILNTREELGF